MSDANVQNLIGDDRGVLVGPHENTYLVQFEFDRALVDRMREVPGAEFDNTPGVKAWVVPAEQEEKLAEVIEAIRVESLLISQDKAHIEALATNSAVARQTGAANDGKVAPKISDYIEKGNNYSGDILNVNGRFAAQLTGFGKDNGAAFVTVHRLANLQDQVFKGDNVRIKYNDKGLGEVTDRNAEKTPEQIAADFNESLGQRIDGVTVEEQGDKLLVSFDFNPALQHRLQRVDGVEFNKEAKVYVAPAANRDFIARAVSEMRTEFREDQRERADLTDRAALKLDAPKVRDAFTKDDTKHYGTIVATSERYAMQFSGKDDFKLHRVASLELDGAGKLRVGDDVKITYQKGRGAVENRTREASPEKPLDQSKLPPEVVGSVEHKAQALLAAGKGPATGVFIGEIIGKDADRGLVYQDQGRNVTGVHLASSLSRVPQIGELATISFKDGQGKVADPKQQGQSQAR